MRYVEVFLYKGSFLCVPEKEDMLQWIREAHTSRVAGHFGINKTLINLRRYVFWPQMTADVTKFVGGCKLFAFQSPPIGNEDCIYRYRYREDLEKIS